MSKIAKYIKLALHNSSAAEASSALKMAASAMAKEGVNPSEYLQEKGGYDDSARVEALEEKIIFLNRTISEKNNVIQRLERQLNEAKTANNGASNRSLLLQIEDLQDEQIKLRRELREAKETAIKWHDRAQALEADLKETAQASVMYQNKIISQSADIEVLRKYVKWGALGAVVAAFVCFGFGINQGEANKDDLKRENSQLSSDIYSKDQQIQNLEAKLFEATGKSNPFDKYDAPKAPVAAPKPVKKRINPQVDTWTPKDGNYTAEILCNAVNGSQFPVKLGVHTLENYIDDIDQHMPENATVVLPKVGAAYKGYKTKLTYQDGSSIDCRVTHSYE